MCDQEKERAEIVGKVERVVQTIYELVGECFQALKNELTFMPLSNCFEFFGFDFLRKILDSIIHKKRFISVDSDWNCWLLEANAEPDFRQTGGRLKPMLSQMFEETFRLVIDNIRLSHNVLLTHFTNSFCALVNGNTRRSKLRKLDTCL